MNDKSILITGAANGIGKTIAEHCSRDGYRVGLLAMNEKALRETASNLANSEVLVADVTRPGEVEAAFDQFGTPDTIVNNAGIVRFGPLIEQSVEDFIQTVNINLIGTYIVSREGAHRMKQAGGGHIINMSSINSRTPGPGAGAYPATKAGVTQMARQLAIELGDANIRVNAIAPGFIDAGMSAPIYEDEKVRNKRAGAVPSGRLGTADDIAAAVLYLDSDAGSYVNGHELVIDGGVVHSLLAQLPRD